MGITLEQYRSAIGRFVPANRSVCKSHPVPKKKGHVGRRIGILPFIAIVSALLLVTAGLETNPGPAVKVSAYLDPSPIDLEYVSVVTALLELVRGQTPVVEFSKYRYIAHSNVLWTYFTVKFNDNIIKYK